MRAALLVCLIVCASASAEDPPKSRRLPEVERLAAMNRNERYDEWKRMIARGKPSVPIFAAMLNDEKRSLRGLGASGLAQLGPVAREAVPALRAVFDNPMAVGQVRLLTVAALGNIGPDAAPAIPRIRALLESSHRVEVVTAAVALTKIDPGAKGLPEAVAKLVGPGGLETRHALWMVQQLGSRAKASRDNVVKVIRADAGVWTRRDAVRALAACDGGSEATRTLLRALLDDAAEPVRVEAAARLTEAGAGDKRSTQVLAKALPSKVAFTRATAAVAMLRVEPG